ncbi:MAG TPA: octanoyltransferase, partial [Wenzhouxiangella sp.]|nr:octanoyltransferase [Wenzhouxiangella sp.]
MDELIVRWLGRQPFGVVWAAMKAFNDSRDESTADELWLVEHDPVFTQGLAGRPDHLLDPGEIPIVQTDRGGQVTYHGPGQVVAYP